MDLLSFDVAEIILSSIASPGDLLALALTSHYWAGLILPHHIQYRKLFIGSEDHLPLWTHLAIRKDLAKNVREVHMSNVRRRGERCPTTLVPVLDVQPEEEETIFLRAFQNLERLEIFTWRAHKCPGYMDPHRNYKLFDILSNARYMRSIDILSVTRWQKKINETLWKTHPVFNLRNLTRFDLSGPFWRSFNQDFPLTSVLMQCPDIEEFSIFHTEILSTFTTCFFPRLRRLTIIGTGNSEIDLLKKFLHKHKTVQELTWYPLGGTRLLPDSLPALQKITSNHTFIMNLLQDETVPNRVLHNISRIHLDPPSIKILEEIDGSQVRELFLCPCAGVQGIRRIAKLFPNVVTLGILDEPFYDMMRVSIDDEICSLSLFPALECILTARIWTMISKLREWEARQDAITKLAYACPNLKYIVPSSPPKRKIVLSRDGEQVTWIELYLGD
ncbi:hypothetical protein BDZ94DRAFT_1309339 [Collybia nuda]|uniref:F-box domain-containing protein n=1 Tax=Collybia nuda TaxID=64659 RepID=A0A9P5Y3U8_9AGAR|nr:hypothetical protein BDZ94DRAFT_1309339 [Collybia nuda]